MIIPILAYAVLGLSRVKTPALAAVDLSVNVAQGEVLTGEKAFRVTVKSESPVQQVEFYVNDELRSNDTSTPYEFNIDTLTLNDGPLKLKFIAYNTKNERGTKEVGVTIDNGVSKGAEYHIQHGKELLIDSKWDLALVSGRVALKAQPDSVPARIIMARAYLGKGDLDKAQNYAQEASAKDPNNLEVIDLLSGISLQQAFNTYNRGGGDRVETAKAIRVSLGSAATNRRKSLDAAVDNYKTIDAANMLAYADAATRAGRYSAAISQLAPAFSKDTKNLAVGNRLAFVYLRAGRVSDARDTTDTIVKYGTPDAYTMALKAVIAQQMNDTNASNDAMKDAILNDSDNPGVKTAQAYIALRRGNTATLGNIATDLSKDEGQRTEVSYFLSTMNNRMGKYDLARKFFEQAVMAEPANADMYIEQANESIDIALSGRVEKKERDYQIENARQMFEVAQIANPSAAEPLTGLAIVALIQNKYDDATKFAQAAYDANPNYAAASYTLAGAAQREVQVLQAAASKNRQQVTQLSTNNPEEAARLRALASQQEREATDLLGSSQRMLAKAASLDDANLSGRQGPDGPAAWRYFSTYGRAVIMAPPR